MDCAKPFPQWQGFTMELRNALTTSSDASLVSKHITYSMTAASQGTMILPSSLANPNSSCDMLRSTPKMAVPRYASGTSNRLLSAEYTTQWPFPATGELLLDDPSVVPFAGVYAIRLLAMAATLCHFFAI